VLAAEEQNPTVFHLSGRYGLHLLLRVLAGEAGWAQYQAVAGSPASRLRWNKQFTALAHAVLLGRAGRSDAAAAAVAEASSTSEPYAMAKHLGLRLVSESAISDGWGTPVAWLRAAEEYFHSTGGTAVASACRALLRTVGAPVGQRRSGADRVPPVLRQAGLTVREYEVLQFVADRHGNRAIADRLHLSPRTVEKHVANLLQKTGRPDRTSLSDYARQILPDGQTRFFDRRSGNDRPAFAPRLLPEPISPADPGQDRG
jgi:DNA-binding CsgD family transcriptional regulator